jgi:Na+/H+-dicarboxylate symporter
VAKVSPLKFFALAGTATNVAGQIVVPTIVARSEGLLDDQVLDAPTTPPAATAAPRTPVGVSA